MGLAAASSEPVLIRREGHLHWIEEVVNLLAFDTGCARAYRCISTATAGVGRKVRGNRAVDLMIAATALAYELPLYTRNVADLRGLGDLIEIVDLS